MSGRGCMILAAGFGTRMGALTADRPKPLIELAGRFLIDHALTIARGIGAAPIAVNGHYRADQLRAHLSGMDDVTFLHETPDILDSGGGVRNALPVLGTDPFFTLNSDAAWAGENPLSLLERHWDAEVMDALMLVVPRERAVGRQGGGDLSMDADGRLAFDPEGDVWTGAQILKPALFDGCPEGPFPIRPVWERVAGAGRLFGCVYPGHWADVGHPAGLAAAERMLEGFRDV